MSRGAAAALLLAVAVAGCGPPRSEARSGAPADTAVVPFRLGDPSPNPFQEEVRIPFRLGPEPGDRTTSPGRPDTAAADSAVVSAAVYNVLYQRVAWVRTPESRDGGTRVRRRRYGVPGRYDVVWRGRADGGRRVPAGPYFLELVVNGRTAVRKVILTR